MNARIRQSETGRRTADEAAINRSARRAFTLIELSVSMGIISILILLSTFAFRKVAESNTQAQAENAVLTYAKLARSYAVANRVETMMVVNPFNGRFELWHPNPPADGGPWNPLSDGTGAQPTDGYRFSPGFDSGAGLPVDSSGKPLAAVHPIDFDPPAANTYRPTNSGNVDQDLDNLTWAAICFDPTGRLVVRTRRIATRTYTRRDGTLRPDAERNRLSDETPDLARPTIVDMTDSPITSTRGFVISDLTKLRVVVPDYNRDPQKLVNEWLKLSLPGQPYSTFARKIILNRFTGQELLKAS